MRPRRTAVVITVLTGSLISALSLGLMLLVSRQLRVGLFELDTLQARLKDSREQLDTAERERIEARKATVRIEAELKAAQQRAQTLRQELAPLQEQRLASRPTEIVSAATSQPETLRFKKPKPSSTRCATASNWGNAN